MRRDVRWLATVLCCTLGLLGAPAAFADGATAPTEGTTGSLAGSLVTVGSPAAGEQAVAAIEAQLANPAAVAEREVSRTKYEHLDAEQAAKVADGTFPSLLDEPAGGPPKLPSGQSIGGFPADDAAQLDLPQGRRAVVVSSEPIALETSSGQRTPIDLSLSEVGGAFEPQSPAVPVRIPKHLEEGVSLAGTGVSMRPVGAGGSSLSGSEGELNGASAFFANTQTDTDTLVKATTFGFELDGLLRSVESPEQLSYRVGLPEGATLVGASNKSEGVMIVKEGDTLARIPAPVARDAAGTNVPVAMTVNGSTVTLVVADSSGEFDYPIAVDPTVIDESAVLSFPESWWKYYTAWPEFFKHSTNGSEECPGSCEASGFSEPAPGDWGYFYYVTQGASRIYEFHAITKQSLWPNIESKIYVAGALGAESNIVSLPNTEGVNSTETTLCVVEGCTPAKVETNHEANGAFLEQYASGGGKQAWAWGNQMSRSLVYINQEAEPTVAFDTKDATIHGEQNPLYGPRWGSGVIREGWELGAEAYDPGTGIYKYTWYSPNAPKWGLTFNKLEAGCKGVQCPRTPFLSYELESEYWDHTTEHLPEGEDTVELKVEDAVGLAATTKTIVKVDNAPPYNLSVMGLPSTHEIDDGQHFLLKGSATSKLAGVASLRLTMDGQEVGTPAKGCASGPCTANGEWTLSGEAYAAGQYTLDLIATDNAGNVATEELHVTIHHAGGVAVTPGSVNPVTGELSLAATDVSIAAPDGGLTVGRGYRSRHVAQGAEGPLGPQWILSLGSQQSLSRTASGSMVLTGSSGEQTVFASNGKGGFTSPSGDASLTLTEKVVSKVIKFELSQNGAVTSFALPTGSSGSVWVPSISEGAGGTSATTFSYRLEGGLIEPTEELAPVPAGVSCSPTLHKGCRVLKFEYASKEAKVPGENPSEWGEYPAHLVKVTYTAWNSSTKEMPAVAVAQYAYDKQGRLRAEWNPTIEPSLKTVYGYDTEGHVTAVSQPGQQPALLEQGTVSGDAGTGRLLAVSRPAASTTSELKEEMAEPAPVNTSGPTLSSTTPKVGVKISVSGNGTWSNKPLAYSYRWEDCNSSGKECTAIPGAVNQAYYPVASDEGHTLVAQVVGLNATGAAVGSSGATSVVAAGTPNTPLPEPPAVGSNSVVTLEYQVPLSGTGAPQQMGPTEVATWGQIDIPAEAMAIFPPDKPMGWPAKEYTRASIEYLDSRDRVVNTAMNPQAGIANVSTTEYNLDNDVTRTLSPDNRAAALKETCETEKCKSAELAKLLDTESTYEEKGSEPGTELLSTLGPQHTIELTNRTQVEGREHTIYSYNEGAPAEGGPYHLVTKMVQNAVIEGKEDGETRTTKTSYSAQNNLGWKLRKPTAITTAAAVLNYTHSIFYEPKTGGVTETRTPAAGAPGEEQGDVFSLQFGKSGTENGQLKEPQDIAVTTSGDEYVLDTANSRVEEFNAKGEYVRKFGAKGAENGDLSEPKGIALDSSGDVWVADTGNSRIEEFSATGTYITKFGSKETLKEPQGIAVNTEGDVWVADTGNSRIVEYYPEGPSEEKHYYIEQKFGTKGTGEEQFNEPQGITLGGEGNIYVTDTSNNRIDEYSVKKKEEKAKHVRNFSKEGTVAGDLKAPHAISTDAAGDVWVADSGNNRIDEFGPTGTYIQTFGKEGTAEGKLKAPEGIAIDSEGNAWVADTANSNAQEWTPNGTGYGSGTASAHGTQTIYYTAGVNSKVTTCGEHPEWANLPCQTQPAAQPEGSLPKLPVTTYTYNLWDEPEVTTNTSGATTRTTTESYDAAGRPKTTTISSTVGTSLPPVTDEYSSESGALEKQTATTEHETKTIANGYNTLGQLVSYTDAAEKPATTTYEYDVDGRIAKVNDSKGTETYTYSKTSGVLSELLNEYGTSKLLFTGKYDLEGRLSTEGYPNGMNATYSYNAIGDPVALEYQKTTHCTEEKEKCKWFTDKVVPSAHNQWLSQTSTLSKQAYTYDAAARLTTVEDTPVGGPGCILRMYGYDADTNRDNETTREPNAKGECASEGGTEEKHTYDTADRLTDTGVTYNAWGDITALPATDAGGKESSEELTSIYYTDNQLASQTQNGETIGYDLDPGGRTIETVATGKKDATTTNHYAGPGDAPAWTENLSGETSRNIPGITGSLSAIQNNAEAPVLQLTNLHGDIIATAYLSETATELASKADTTEYGVPTTSLPPKYSWLGALEVPTELPSGVIAMGARSYIPQLGRFLQPDPVPGGSASAYGYTFGDPINSSDPSGSSTLPPAWAIDLGQQYADEAVAARKAAEEAAAREAAEAAARAAAAAAASAGGLAYAGMGEWGEEEWGEEEWGEEDGGTEEAAYHPGAKGQEEVHIEPAVLVQPLAESAAGGGAEASSVVPLCEPGVVSSHPCAHRILRFHWHWWGVSVALSRHDMHHLSQAMVAIAAAVAVPAGEVASALGVGAVASEVLVEQDKCWTIWFRWVPPSHETRPERCYG
jgi:RHS repeat-associated protein